VSTPIDVELGREAYARRAWREAHEHLAIADEAEPLTTDDLELLATTAFMLGRDDEYLGVLERAHHAHLEAGETLPAVRNAIWIGRTQGVGVLTAEEATNHSLSGPMLRASGVDYDVRKDDPYLSYPDVPWKVVTDDHGDVFGRTLVRVGELVESTNIVRHCLENLPEGAIRIQPPRAAPKGEVLSRYEAPRGELVHFIRTNNTDKVERLDIRTPTLANWTSVAVSLVGQHLADIPVVVAAIDPCLSCTSRVTIVDREDRETKTMTWEELRAHGMRFYREKRGV